MIEKRHVDYYASASGVDSEVAEKDIVLTYILKTMRDDGMRARTMNSILTQKHS